MSNSFSDFGLSAYNSYFSLFEIRIHNAHNTIANILAGKFRDTKEAPRGEPLRECDGYGMLFNNLFADFVAANHDEYSVFGVVNADAPEVVVNGFCIVLCGD